MNETVNGHNGSTPNVIQLSYVVQSNLAGWAATEVATTICRLTDNEAAGVRFRFGPKTYALHVIMHVPVCPLPALYHKNKCIKKLPVR